MSSAPTAVASLRLRLSTMPTRLRRSMLQGRRFHRGKLTSEKAARMREIRDELEVFPDSSVLAGECDRIFALAEERRVQRAALVEEGVLRERGGTEGTEVTHGDIEDVIGAMEIENGGTNEQPDVGKDMV